MILPVQTTGSRKKRRVKGFDKKVGKKLAAQKKEEKSVNRV